MIVLHVRGRRERCLDQRFLRFSSTPSLRAPVLDKAVCYHIHVRCSHPDLDLVPKNRDSHYISRSMRHPSSAMCPTCRDHSVLHALLSRLFPHLPHEDEVARSWFHETSAQIIVDSSLAHQCQRPSSGFRQHSKYMAEQVYGICTFEVMFLSRLFILVTWLSFE